MNHIFVNPKVTEKIQTKVNKLAKVWDYDKNDLFQLYQMVATIESGLAERTFYDKNGIVVDGWNGYKDFDNQNVNPKSAWGGFYRMEKAQMVGWSIYMIANAEDKHDQASRCTNAYGYWFVWEEEPRVWGYKGWQEFYTEDEANQFVSTLTGNHIKSLELKHSDISGCWRVTVTTTRRKPNTTTVYRERVAV